MDDKPQTGELFGVPYNFEAPTAGRMLSAYWKPDEEMIVEKPFGIGYTLNLANWRAWAVLLVAGVLLYQERSSRKQAAAEAEARSTDGERDDEPVEVIVSDD